MDDAETIAQRFLASLGYEDVVFEPDGNVTPDFLVDKAIAVEVRRIVAGHESDGRVESLKTAQQSLRRVIAKALATFGPSTGSDYWVSYTSKTGSACKSGFKDTEGKLVSHHEDSAVCGGGV